LSNDNPPKYVSAKPDQEIVPHKEVLYGAELARHAIVICEGPIDAWAIGPGAVCSFGLTYTEHQLKVMGSFPIRAVCFDNEPMAYRQAKKLQHQLSVFPGETSVIRLESGKDPAECDPIEIEAIRRRFL
jgi:DNA primase